MFESVETLSASTIVFTICMKGSVRGFLATRDKTLDIAGRLIGIVGYRRYQNTIDHGVHGVKHGLLQTGLESRDIRNGLESNGPLLLICLNSPNQDPSV